MFSEKPKRKRPIRYVHIYKDNINIDIKERQIMDVIED